MNRQTIETIVHCMATVQGMSEIQSIQTEHRLRLAAFWGIQAGDRVLEIGCGQGDTTAALAYLVGKSGSVHAIDIGSPDYGAPFTLGEAATILQQSELGQQIQIEFEVDVLSPEVDFPAQSFDVIVMSHCSWYMKSFDELRAIFQKVRKWGKRLAFAEWDLRITKIEQQPHFLAVMIQAQYECFKEHSHSNVRTLFTANDVRRLAEEAGWSVVEETSIFSKDLQDGKWEVDLVVQEYQKELAAILEFPSKMGQLIESQVALLEEALEKRDILPMAAYAFLAR